MKKYLFLLLITCSAHLSFSQWTRATDKNQEKWNSLKGGLLLIPEYSVKEYYKWKKNKEGMGKGNLKTSNYTDSEMGEELKAFQKELRKTIEKQWTFSNYKFISQEEYNQKCKNPDLFFLNYHQHVASGANYFTIYISAGNPKGMLEYKAPLADIVASSTLNDVSLIQFLPLTIKNLQWRANHYKEYEYKKYGMERKDFDKEYIHSKNLNILKNEFIDKEEHREEFVSNYPGKVTFLNPYTLNKIWENESKDLMYRTIDAGIIVLHMIYELETGKLIYFSQHNYQEKKYPAKLIKYEFKKWY